MYTDSTTQALYVPIDVGKNVHCYAGYAGAELTPVVPPTKVRTHRPGYAQFCRWLKQMVTTRAYTTIVVGMEPTGVYHEPWAHALHTDFTAPVTVQLVDPYRTKQKRKQLQNRPLCKTDEIDVEALAYCLRDGIGRGFAASPTPSDTLRLVCQRYAAVQRDQRRLSNRLHSLLDRMWPGAFVDVAKFKHAHPHLEPPTPLVATIHLQRKLVQGMLGYNPDPYFWQSLSPDAICATLRAQGTRCGPKTAGRLWRVFQELLLPPPTLVRPLIAPLRNELARYLQLSDDLQALRQRAESVLEASLAAVVATIPGISAFLAAQYVGLVGDITRFAHADQVWAMVGYDTIQSDSGDRRRHGKLTKRGKPYGRAVLYQMGICASKDCPAIARAKTRARQRGKTKIEANIHAAHKTNRMCFYLLKHGVPYDAQRAR
jgi:transposase